MLDDEEFPIQPKSNFPANNVRALASNLPKTSGVYLFKNSRQKVLYVGKAKNLRARVSSYFGQIEDAMLNSKTRSSFSTSNNHSRANSKRLYSGVLI